MFDIPIKFQFDVESEINRVKNTLDTLDWLTQNNYRFLLPNDIKDTKDIDAEKVRESVKSEFNLQIYQTAEAAILKSWKGNNNLIKNINEKMEGSYKLDEINIILTRYGTQGSYKIPNSIVINISNIPPEFLIKTVIHESFHLMIEPLVKEYSIEHFVKERMVNLIMDLEYKSRFKMNISPDWALATDAVFKNYYPNLILIMKEVAKIIPKN
jgi:hypothetical protein